MGPGSLGGLGFLSEGLAAGSVALRLIESRRDVCIDLTASSLPKAPYEGQNTERLLVRPLSPFHTLPVTVIRR